MTDQSTDLATTGERNNAMVQHPGGSSGQMLAMIADAARDPTVDAQKMVTLADLAIKLQDREQVREFNAAKAAAIIEMPYIKRDGRIVIPGKGGEPDRIQGRFVKYETLQAVIDPILAKHGLVITHHVDNNGPTMTVTPILTHVNGYVERGGAMPLPLDTSGGKNNVQGAGSSLSYGMRYTATAMLHIRIHGIDDDGNLGQAETAGDNLSASERALVDGGMSAALQGSAAYEDWFKAQPAAARGWLAFGAWHEKNKAAAAMADKH